MKAKHILFFIFSLILFSCQKEESEIVDDSQNPNSSSLVSNSTLVKLISRTSQNPTAIDNVLDTSSCFSVQLPVTVIVNGNTIVVTSQTDYQTVKDAIDAYTTDDDIVHFVYPITIKHKNFSTQVLNNVSEFNDVLDKCPVNDGFDEIDCIAINYPIIINVYDVSNQIADAITITSNLQLYNYVTSLNAQSISKIVYPISVTNSSGLSIVIKSNSELTNFIEDSIDDCSDSGTGSQFYLSGSYHISYFFDDEDETDDYDNYTFNFYAATVHVTKNGNNAGNGTWYKYTNNGKDWINLNFDNSELEELVDEEWQIVESTPTELRLKHTSNGGSETDYLYFTKN